MKKTIIERLQEQFEIYDIETTAKTNFDQAQYNKFEKLAGKMLEMLGEKLDL